MVDQVGWRKTHLSYIRVHQRSMNWALYPFLQCRQGYIRVFAFSQRAGCYIPKGWNQRIGPFFRTCLCQCKTVRKDIETQNATCKMGPPRKSVFYPTTIYSQVSSQPSQQKKVSIPFGRSHHKAGTWQIRFR